MRNKGEAGGREAECSAAGRIGRYREKREGGGDRKGSGLVSETELD